MMTELRIYQEVGNTTDTIYDTEQRLADHTTQKPVLFQLEHDKRSHGVSFSSILAVLCSLYIDQ